MVKTVNTPLLEYDPLINMKDEIIWDDPTYEVPNMRGTFPLHDNIYPVYRPYLPRTYNFTRIEFNYLDPGIILPILYHPRGYAEHAGEFEPILLAYTPSMKDFVFASKCENILLERVLNLGEWDEKHAPNFMWLDREAVDEPNLIVLSQLGIQTMPKKARDAIEALGYTLKAPFIVFDLPRGYRTAF